MGERLVRNEEVRGSIPLSSTSRLKLPLYKYIARTGHPNTAFLPGAGRRSVVQRIL